MKNEKNKWVWCGQDDDDNTTKRVFSASTMTIKRLQTIRNYVKRHNAQWFAPYGTSPNGYAYTCGCSHDCCGCVTRNRMTIDFNSKAITILHSVSYNY
jgi:hypothetical protein